VTTWLTGPPGPDAEEEIAESAQSLWQSTLDAAPRLWTALAIIVAGWLLSRLLRWALARHLRRRRTPSFATVMSKVAGWVLLAAVVLIAVAVTFPSVKPVDLLAGLGVFSLAIGFAFQDILENTLSGILLLFRQPFRSGDQIQVMERVGTVDEINIRETRMTTFDGELVVVPNRDVYKNVIVVFTHNDLRRQDFLIGIAFESDLDEATEVVTRALAEVTGVASDPAPSALVDELGTSTINLRARFWSSPRRFDGLLVRDAAIKHVKRRLDEAEIEMPSEIVVLQAAPSLQAAIRDDPDLMITPGGGVRSTGPR
jgi:small-conductance mechanosensitive channel